MLGNDLPHQNYLSLRIICCWKSSDIQANCRPTSSSRPKNFPTETVWSAWSTNQFINQSTNFTLHRGTPCTKAGQRQSRIERYTVAAVPHVLVRRLSSISRSWQLQEIIGSLHKNTTFLISFQLFKIQVYFLFFLPSHYSMWTSCSQTQS